MDKKNNQNDNPNKKKNIKSAIILLVVCLGITALFTSVMSRYKNGSQKKISYSKFLTMLEKGEIKKVQVADRKIYIEPKTQQNPLMKTTYYTVSMNDALLVNRLKEAEDNNKISSYEQQDSSGSNAILSVMVSYVLPFVLIYAMMYFVMRGIGKGGGMMGSVGKSNAKVYVEKKTGVTFADVAGQDEAKESLTEMVDFLHNPGKYIEIGARLPKGALLVGPPGTGKTLLAKAVAGEANAPFLSISGSDFVEMYVGVGASRVRDLFSQAIKKAPAIVFIDEIDAVGRHRGAGTGGGNDEREQTLNQLLVEMDGFDSNSGVIVMAATNRPDVLDPALLRPGRFDRQITVNRPDAQGREDILKVHAKNKPLAPDVNLKDLAQMTIGFTGADLENLLNEAALLAARKHKKALTNEEIQDAVTRVEMGTEKKSHKYSEKAKKLTAYHEAGHAVASYYLENHDPVKEISIIPRGMGAGGYTMYQPQEENYTSKNEMLDLLVSMLGGRVAEALTLDDVSTGASSDLQRATQICRDMVAKYGMSDEIGPVVFSDENNEVFLGKDFGHVNNYSEVTSARIDEEIEKMMRSAYAKTQKILSEHYDKLILVGDTLLAKEKIDGNQFESLMKNGNLIDDAVDNDTADTAGEEAQNDSDFQESTDNAAKADEVTNENVNANESNKNDSEK